MIGRLAEGGGCVTINVRQASNDDVEALVVLNHFVQELHVTYRPGHFKMQSQGRSQTGSVRCCKIPVSECGSQSRKGFQQDMR